MWNSEAPLKLLMSLPAQLNIENLKKIQKVIDEDKFINSRKLCRDLCGEYAPFCDGCDKGIVKYPCAVAYVKMKQAEGLEIEIAATDDELVNGADEEEVVEEVVEEVEEPVQEITEYTGNKNHIRIAIARKKR